jgi:hypothetical protein
MKSISLLMACGFFTALSVVACTSPAPAPTVPPAVTVLTYQTPVVPTVAPTTLPPTIAPSPAPPTATVVPSPTATPMPAPACKNGAAFVTDVTIRDGTWVQLGQAFTKTWRMQNIGDCTWDSNYRFAFVGGTAMTTALAHPIPSSVAPGKMADLAIPLTAPLTTGSYTSQWQLRDQAGAPFGPVVYVIINAGSPPPPQPQHISLAGDWTSGAYSLRLQEAYGCGSYPCNYLVEFSYWTGGTPEIGSGSGVFTGSSFNATIPGSMPGAPAKIFTCAVSNSRIMTCQTTMGTLTFTR